MKKAIITIATIAALNVQAFAETNLVGTVVTDSAISNLQSQVSNLARTIDDMPYIAPSEENEDYAANADYADYANYADEAGYVGYAEQAERADIADEVRRIYMLENLTGESVTLADRQIGNVTLGPSSTNLSLTLEFNWGFLSGDTCVLYMQNAADTRLSVLAPSPNHLVSVGADLTKPIAAGTNLVTVTRVMCNAYTSTVHVAVEHIR